MARRLHRRPGPGMRGRGEAAIRACSGAAGSVAEILQGYQKHPDNGRARRQDVPSQLDVVS